MDPRYHEFCLADPDFYQPPSHAASGSQDLAAGRQLPPGWHRHPQGRWTVHVPPDSRLPDQGWKIHVSATLDTFSATLDTLWEYCLDRRIWFKHLSSRLAFVLNNMKYADRAGSGKFITIYPRDDRQLQRILTDLDPALHAMPGPYVLSDARWGDGPLHVRYGGFAERYCRTAVGGRALAIREPSGRLVPDRRGPRFHLPEWAEVPDFLTDAVRARTAPPTPHEFPYRVDRPLHYSNAGGVYLARELSGDRRVVLKEARPRAGIDAHGNDAVRRLRREAEFLRKLSGTGITPECLGDFVCWEHHFLVLEYLPGRTLGRAMVERNPLMHSRDDPDELARYTEWALTTLAEVERKLTALHRDGVVFGDLHPHNILLADDGDLRFIDLEEATHVTDRRPSALGAPGYLPMDGRVGTEADRYALACLRIAMFLPLTMLLALDPGKLPMLLAAVAERFPVPAGFLTETAEVLRDRRPVAVAAAPTPHPDVVTRLTAGVAAGAADWPAVTDSMRDAVLASATPDRADRLFPGDIDQFSSNGLNLAYGAAGVLAVLSRHQPYRHPGYERWLVESVRRGAHHGRIGLYDGLCGVACVLADLGRHEDARDVLDQVLTAPLDAVSDDLFAGLAGIGIGLLWLAGQLDDQALRQRALDLADRLAESTPGRLDGRAAGRPAERTTRAAPPGGGNGRAGLMYGPSGQALFQLRLYESTGDRGHLDRAEALLAQDLQRCVLRDGGILHVNEGWRTLPYLSAGSAGIGLVLREFLGHRERGDFAEALAGIRRAADSDFVIGSGLFSGRAGLVTFLAAATGPGPDTDTDTDTDDNGHDSAAALDRHLRRFAWHMLPWRGRVAFPGDQLLRLSMDLATGSAGVLLALDAAAGRRHPMLSFLGLC